MIMCVVNVTWICQLMNPKHSSKPATRGRNNPKENLIYYTVKTIFLLKYGAKDKEKANG